MARRGRHVATSRSPLRLLAGARRLRHGLGTAVLGLATVALLGAAFALVGLHVSAQTVLTGSMRGTFDPGALVLTRPVAVSTVRPGDVIVFTPPGESAPYTHRVVTVSGHPEHPVLTTKGDANPSPDAWQARLTGTTVPKVFGSVPHVGRLLLALHGRGLHTALLALLGTVVAVSGTRLILGSPGPRHTPHPA
jgi:signal peptidase